LDNLTHTLVGVMLSRAGLNRTCPRATPLLILAANAPDIDVIAWSWSQERYLNYHRGFTHGFPLLLLVALLPVLITGLLYRRDFRPAPMLAASVIGVLSHVLLDWTNIYGTRLLAPISPRWHALDITSVVDLWIWLVLLACFFWPLLARMVSYEIGARPVTGAGTAILALCFLLIYNGARYILHHRAVETLNARLHAGHVPRRVAAFPTIANPLAWYGLAEVENAYVLYRINLLGDFDPSTGRVLYQSQADEVLRAARVTPAFQTFLNFSRFPLWRVVSLPEPEGGHQAECVDLRFGVPGDGRFTAMAVLDRGGRVKLSWFQFGTPRARIAIR